MKKYIYSERAELFEPNIYIQILVQITGNPTSDALVSAIKAAFAANEATMSRIVLDKNGDAYYQLMSESGSKVSVSADDWKETIRQNEKVPFAIDKGELMRVFVSVIKDEVFLLVIAHHLVGDGKSVTYFIEDVMTVLSGGSLVYKPMQLITKESFPKKFELPLLLKLYVKIFNRKWKRTGRTFNWDDYYDIHKVYWKERSSEIIYEHFSPGEINRIHAHTKEIGVSVNSYIATAFLEANKDNGSFGMAASVRLDNNKAMSNQVTGIRVDHTFSEKISFDENVQLIHQKVLDKLNAPGMKYFILQFISSFIPGLIDSVLLYTYGLYQNKTSYKLAKVLGYDGRETRGFSITNLTRLDILNTYGKYGLKNGLFIAPVVSYTKRIIGISTMEDGMNISYHFMSNQDREPEEEFFKQAIRNIKI